MVRRHATLGDLDALVTMGERFVALTPYRQFMTANPAQMRALAQQLIDSPDGVVIVAEDASGPIGMIGVLVYAHHMSGARIGGEIFWWVEPEHRGIGIRLMKDAEHWVKARGGTAMQMIAPTPNVEALYERLGYIPVERTYQRTL